jgi:antitoxin component HigA of HigAB toxin-antitoxin module
LTRSNGAALQARHLRRDNGGMTGVPFDPSRYSELLSEARPALIDSAEEYERLIAIAERLIERGEDLPPEEEKLLALLTLLINVYEVASEGVSEGDDDDEENEPTRLPMPHETLGRLLEARGLEQRDVAHVFGNPAVLNEVMAGKRAISRGQSKELGKFFKVPPKLFQS